MGSEVPCKPRALAGGHEAQLDLPAAQRPGTPREERRLDRAASPCDVVAQERRGPGEEDLLAPSATLQPLDQDPSALEVDVTAAEKQHLSYAKRVVVHDAKKGPIADAPHGGVEAPDLVLSQVAWQLLVGMREDGQTRAGDKRSRHITPNRRKAHSGRRRTPQADETGSKVS